MLYDRIKKVIDEMLEEIYAEKEECYEIISFNLIRDQNLPITIETKLLYPLNKIKISLYCPFLLVEPDITFEEIYRQGHEEDQFKLMRLIAKFSTTLERLKEWVETEAPEMIRWGEGVIFDSNGRARRIPYPFTSSSKKTKSGRTRGRKSTKKSV